MPARYCSKYLLCVLCVPCGEVYTEGEARLRPYRGRRRDGGTTKDAGVTPTPVKTPAWRRRSEERDTIPRSEEGREDLPVDGPGSCTPPWSEAAPSSTAPAVPTARVVAHQPTTLTSRPQAGRQWKAHGTRSAVQLADS